MSKRRLVTVYFLVLLPRPLIPQAGRVERLTRGDTTVIRTTGNGTWGPSQDAVEVLRIGRKANSTTFGAIDAIAATPSGGVALFDQKAIEGPIAKLFSASGALLKSFGPKGAGPAEIGGCNPECLTVAIDGTIAMSDWQNLRISRFNADGSYRDGFRVSDTGGGIGPEILTGPARSLYRRTALVPSIRAPHGIAEEMARTGYLQFSSNGQIMDSILSPKSWLTTNATYGLEPLTYWVPLPDGRLAVGASDRLGFLIRPIHASGPVLLIEGPTQRVPFLAAERKEREAIAAWANGQGLSQARVPTPKTPPELKPAYKLMQVDINQRIWLQRFVTAMKVPLPSAPPASPYTVNGRPVAPIPVSTYKEPPVYTAFMLDGTYLGEVRFPLGVEKITFSGGFAWGVVKDEDGEQFVVKYRLPAPSRN